MIGSFSRLFSLSAFLCLHRCKETFFIPAQSSRKNKDAVFHSQTKWVRTEEPSLSETHTNTKPGFKSMKRFFIIICFYTGNSWVTGCKLSSSEEFYSICWQKSSQTLHTPAITCFKYYPHSNQKEQRCWKSPVNQQYSITSLQYYTCMNMQNDYTSAELSLLYNRNINSKVQCISMHFFGEKEKKSIHISDILDVKIWKVSK